MTATQDFNANQYRQIYPAMGVDLDQLGCVMLDTAEPILSGPGTAPLNYLLNEVAHVTEHPERFWIKGIVGASETSHVTLLYGLLPVVQRQQVDAVLDGWQPPSALIVDHVGVFPSPYSDEPYACIVAHLDIGDELREAHARLSMLPHLDTFPEYRAHITIGYVQTTEEHLDSLVHRLGQLLNGARVAAGALNYGRSIR